MYLFGFLTDPVAIIAAAASALTAVLLGAPCHILAGGAPLALAELKHGRAAGHLRTRLFCNGRRPGNYLLLPRNTRFWKFDNGVPAAPEEWIVPGGTFRTTSTSSNSCSTAASSTSP